MIAVKIKKIMLWLKECYEEIVPVLRKNPYYKIFERMTRRFRFR